MFTKSQNVTLAKQMVFAFLIIQISAISNLFANENWPPQEIQIKGKIISSDDQMGLPGVNVLVKGTTQGTVTDINGDYRLNVPSSDATLIFSSVGYVSQEIPIANKTTIDLTMELDITSLEEIVVIGYGSQRKSHVTGAVSKVKNDKLDQIPVSRADDALIGRIAGVNIQATDPIAGAAPTIRVRGTGSITADAQPFIVLDGIPVDADYLGSIDMNDVESIEVLKDAASAAIYGSRGGNGVIMITTKAGKIGKPVFSFNSYVGAKSVQRNDDIFPSISEWSDFVQRENGSLTDRMVYINQLGTETDWQEQMFDGGMIQNYSLSASGGTENTKFRASASYLGDEGVLLTDNYQKYNIRLNLNTKISKKIEFGLMVNPSYTKQKLFPIGVHDAIRQQTWLPIYHDENTIQYVDFENYPDVKIGDYAMERHFDNYDLYGDGGETDISGTSNANAKAKVLERDRRANTFKLFSNAYLKFQLAEGLSFRTSIGGEYYNIERDYWQGTKADRRGASVTNSLYRTDINSHIVNENILNYDKSFSDHDLNFVGGFTMERWDYTSSETEGTGYSFDNIRTLNAASVVSNGETLKSAQTLVSFLTRVNYAYKHKYLFSFSARADGSSKFGPDKKYGFFPAASVGWRMSEEEFLRNSEFISNMKFRFSYGVTGNNSGIGNYDHIGLLSPVNGVINGGLVPGFNPSNISNSELGWEKSIEINPGIDMGFWSDRLTLSLDFYKRTSEDLLLAQAIPSVTGFTEAIVNIGVVENSGVELELGGVIIDKGDFRWNTSVNFSQNKNKLIDFAGANGLISTVDSKRPTEWIAQEGQVIASFYGYQVEKEIDPEYIKNPFYPIGGQSQDIYVKDLNGDGEITTDDRTVLGSPYPDFIWGFNNQVKYKNFDFSFMFQGAHGQCRFHKEMLEFSSSYT